MPTLSAGVPQARERGFALLVVLWGLVLLSFLVAQVVLAGRTETRISGNVRAATAVEVAADGAIHEALFHLLVAGERHWPASGTHRILVGDTTVQVSIDNLSGRINPNTATPELLRELLRALGVGTVEAARLGEAIVDRRTGGLEPAGRVSSPDRGRIVDLDELGQVAGMTPALLARLRPHLTLWWENDPDPGFADPVVLQAMQALGDARPRRGGAELSSDIRNPSRGDAENPATSATVMPRRVPVRVSS